MRNMFLKKTFFLRNQVTNKQISSFYHVLLVLSHQLYSLRGHHIGSISSQTVTICSISSRVEAFNCFSPFSTKHNIYYRYVTIAIWCIFVVANTNYYLRHFQFSSPLFGESIIKTKWNRLGIKIKMTKRWKNRL